MARLAEITPVRRIGTSRRALTGSVILSGGGAVEFESSLERDHLLLLDFDPEVVNLREQPFTLRYLDEGLQRKYTPDVQVDFLSRSGQSRTVVYEVKPLAVLKEEFQTLRPKFKAAISHCRSRGWKFKIVTEKHIRHPLLKNAKFLKRYKNLEDQPIIREQLCRSLCGMERATPSSLLTATYWHGEKRMSAIPVLWQLVAKRVIGVDLNEPLTMRSEIWMVGK